MKHLRGTFTLTFLLAMQEYFHQFSCSLKTFKMLTLHICGYFLCAYHVYLGIGKATALGLAKKGPRLILGCLNLKKGNAVAEDIKRASGNGNVVVKHLDLASLKSVRKCAEEILREEDRLDVLINNAGILGKFYSEESFCDLKCHFLTILLFLCKLRLRSHHV